MVRSAASLRALRTIPRSVTLVGLRPRRPRIARCLLPARTHVPRELFRCHLQRRPGRGVLANLYRVILSEWMALPVVRHEDPTQIRMTIERDPEQVKHLTFGPAGGRIYAGHARHTRVVTSQA